MLLVKQIFVSLLITRLIVLGTTKRQASLVRTSVTFSNAKDAYSARPDVFN